MIDQRAIRPSRGWYVVAVAVFLLGIAAGVGLFVFGILNVVTDLPKVTTDFQTSTSGTVDLAAGRRYAIYVEVPAGGSDSLSGDCLYDAPAGGDLTLDRPSGQTNLTQGGRTWREIYTAEATTAGTYKITCQPTEGDVRAAHFAVGDAPNVGKFAASLIGGVAGLFGLPILGLLVGAAVALVTALRRSSARKRLQPPGYP